MNITSFSQQTKALYTFYTSINNVILKKQKKNIKNMTSFSYQTKALYTLYTSISNKVLKMKKNTKIIKNISPFYHINKVKYYTYSVLE